jgi:hypothetical protein
MAIMAVFDLEAEQLDALNAFINSLIDKEAYIQYPPGVPRSTKVLMLLRVLYGLRCLPMLWQQELGKVLIELGLKKCLEEPCLYFGEHILIFFFMDDIVILYKCKYKAEIEKFRDNLSKQFPMRHLGKLKWFLGVRIV